MNQRTFNVLILCTGNSGRSIIAEALFNHWGRGRFHAYSAGSFPTGRVNPYALDIIKRTSLRLAEEPRSKSWDEFAKPGAPQMDFVITVCDNAANEVCPVWPGHPMSAHWGVPDPAAVEGSETDKVNAFRATFRELENRIKIFTSLPVEELDKESLQTRMNEIGKTTLRVE